MENICLYFQIHQPFRLRRYRFFDIGEHHYYDNHANEWLMKKMAARCYLPANHLMMELIRKYGDKFKIAFSISGSALDQFALYSPEVLESFKTLAATGNVEFVAEPDAHSLAFIKDGEAFSRQVNRHAERIRKYFNQTPTTFQCSELIYSDTLGAMAASMGFTAMLTEGVKHLLGNSSPNVIYHNPIKPHLKVLLRNIELSDDIAVRFSVKNWGEFPLTTEKFVRWLSNLSTEGQTVNLFMNYECIGGNQPAAVGIFEFFRHLPGQVLSKTKFSFRTPRELAEEVPSVSAIHIPHPVTWADAEKNLTAWLANDLQRDAFDKLYAVIDKVGHCHDPGIARDWRYLQATDHFHYMSAKYLDGGVAHPKYNPYGNPYDAYINYMNVLSDFCLRVNNNRPERGPEIQTTNAGSLISKKGLSTASSIV